MGGAIQGKGLGFRVMALRPRGFMAFAGLAFVLWGLGLGFLIDGLKRQQTLARVYC